MNRVRYSTAYYREPESKQMLDPLESSMAEMAAYVLPNFWPCKRKQAQSLWFPTGDRKGGVHLRLHSH